MLSQATISPDPANPDLAHRPLGLLRPQSPQERRRRGSHVRIIREFGFKIPVLARSDGEVVDGHLRLKAARKLGSWPGGDTSQIPVILCDEWTPAAGEGLPADGESLRDVGRLGRRTARAWNCRNSTPRISISA